MPLTPKQEKAIQEYLTNGGNKTQAYKSAYTTSRMSEKSIGKEAHKLFNNPKVTPRLKELQKQIEDDNKISKDKIVDRLKQIIFEQELIGVDKIDLNAMNKAIDTINKMQGYYAAEKTENVNSETAQLPDWFNKK